MSGPLLVVRHAVAVDRADWAGDDRLRPLTPQGEAQADALAHWLAREAFPVGRLLASPTRRCLATLEPRAARSGLPVEIDDALLPDRVDDAAALARRLVASSGGVLCTHGEVIPTLLEAIGARLTGPPPEDSEKGSVWVLRPAGDALHRTADGDGDGARRLEGHYLGPELLARAAQAGPRT